MPVAKTRLASSGRFDSRRPKSQPHPIDYSSVQETGSPAAAAVNNLSHCPAGFLMSDLQPLTHLPPDSPAVSDSSLSCFNTHSPLLLNLSPNLNPVPNMHRVSPGYDLRKSTRRQSLHDLHNSQHAVGLPQVVSFLRRDIASYESDSPSRKRQKLSHSSADHWEASDSPALQNQSIRSQQEGSRRRRNGLPESLGILAEAPNIYRQRSRKSSVNSHKGFSATVNSQMVGSPPLYGPTFLLYNSSVPNNLPTCSANSCQLVLEHPQVPVQPQQQVGPCPVYVFPGTDCLPSRVGVSVPVGTNHSPVTSAYPGPSCFACSSWSSAPLPHPVALCVSAANGEWSPGHQAPLHSLTTNASVCANCIYWKTAVPSGAFGEATWRGHTVIAWHLCTSASRDQIQHGELTRASCSSPASRQNHGIEPKTKLFYKRSPEMEKSSTTSSASRIYSSLPCYDWSTSTTTPDKRP